MIIPPDLPRVIERIALRLMGDAPLRPAALKAVDDIRDDYDERLAGIVERARDGASQKEIDKDLNDTIAAIALLLLIKGLLDGGVAYDELEEDERRDVDLIRTVWIASQAEHIAGFAETLDRLDDPKFAPEEREKLEAEIKRRIEFWIASGVVLYGTAYANAQADQMGTWHWNPKKLHCRHSVATQEGRVGCDWLNLQRHRLSWFIGRGYIPREPGSKTLGCRGFNCGCEIRSDDGKKLL
jgi:hypothetical protein